MRWFSRPPSTAEPIGWSHSTYGTSRKRHAISGFSRCSQLKHGKRYRDMRRSNVALRLQSSLLDEARRVSAAEGVALKQFINVAVAEKLSALRTEEYFRERGQRGNVDKAKRLLKRAGRRKPPAPGDELM